MTATATPDKRPNVTILVAEDDPDDRFLIGDAFRDNGGDDLIEFVENGEELMSYLRREGEWARLKGAPLPALILLDLNMPRMDGREALRLIKNDSDLCNLPVVAFTTSGTPQDVAQTYSAGANSFISKPKSYDGLVQVLEVVRDYWINTVRLPPISGGTDL